MALGRCRDKGTRTTVWYTGPDAGGLIHLEVGTFRISLITDSFFLEVSRSLLEREEWEINFSGLGMEKEL